MKSKGLNEKGNKLSLFRRVNNWLHLWLGLISGIIVFIVCLTGCLWVFNEEITHLLQPETKVEVRNIPIKTPAHIRQIAAKAIPGQVVEYATYHEGRTVEVGLGDYEATHYTVYINPYTGAVVKKVTHQKGETDFFSWVLSGHRFLWLPYEIGRPIVNYSTMVFVFLLISGLVWWYPRKWTQSTVEKSFKIKWGGTWKRINLDLHNVLGFYSLLFLLAIALTGMVWGIEWYSKALFWTTSGGKSLPEYADHSSDSTKAKRGYTAEMALNDAWNKVLALHPDSKGFYYNFPDEKDLKATVNIYVYPSADQFYNSHGYSFDRHTLAAFAPHEVYDAEFSKASFGVQLRKMNYDIHVGSILGFPGKVLAFLASLIGASLPVTGFIIWWNRKNFGKKKKKAVKKAESAPTATAVATPKFRPKAAQIKG